MYFISKIYIFIIKVYKTDAFDLLTFNLAIERLIEIGFKKKIDTYLKTNFQIINIFEGYPNDIKNFKYDPKFAIRGLWFDKLYGILLKVDTFGNILMAVHGFKVLKG